MRVVIAGSSGLIGTSLVASMRAAGHEVLRLVRRKAAAPDERGWDPYAGRIDDGTFDGVDAVINLCGAGIADKRWDDARKQVLHDSRIVPAEVLSAACVEHGVPTLVSSSGAHFYGDTASRLADEDAPGGHTFMSRLTQDWEAATSAAQEGGVRVVLMRTAVVISPSGGVFGRLKPVFQFFLGGKLGSGDQFFPWVSLDDVVSAYRFVVEHEEIRGPVNVAGPAPVTNAEFTKAVGAALSRPAPWTVPAFALKTLLGGEMAQELLLSGPGLTPRTLERHGFQFLHPTLPAALNAAVA
ncbi:TIGR01777 family oxidoreductase [Lentzea sp. NEAU-D7]|uniref:TIGR01777 family oxidoreductase n=1 Tax=Lentzea sp. NEAU-D7 TaxID=2994667 RepID=UPI00224B6636|nr:TIGR01777 family oxidoreductase [Lentzea sp. NEAU-D7]MCX2954798.1 TIGR01777 family oxidoreductase [Lentzea sp. NEAU-D7]